MGDQKLETSLTQSAPLPSVKEADPNHGKRVSTVGVPAHPALSLAPPPSLPMKPPLSSHVVFHLPSLPWDTPGLLGGARGSPHPFLSLADPPGEMVDSSSTSESSRGRVLMLIQAAATAGSAAVRLTDKHTSPTQGLTFLGDYPVLTCMKSVALLLLEKLGSHSFCNISPCQYCAKKH